MTTPEIRARLEELRQVIHAECISYGELAELQSLAEHIEPGDVELAEWAGIPEEEFVKRGFHKDELEIAQKYPWHYPNEDCPEGGYCYGDATGKIVTCKKCRTAYNYPAEVVVNDQEAKSS